MGVRGADVNWCLGWSHRHSRLCSYLCLGIHHARQHQCKLLCQFSKLNLSFNVHYVDIELIKLSIYFILKHESKILLLYCRLWTDLMIRKGKLFTFLKLQSELTSTSSFLLFLELSVKISLILYFIN